MKENSSSRYEKRDYFICERNEKMEIKKGLNANHIKLIAIVAMTIDHLTWLFFPGLQAVWYVYLLHVIGRLTAPIMWFFIAEGCHYTKDIKKYAGRLFLFAIISHFAYNFAFGIPFMPLSTGVINQTSVMWPLAWAVVLIAVCNNDEIPKWGQISAIVVICLIAFPGDWSSIAVMCPFFLYMHRGEFKKQALDIFVWALIYATVYFFMIDRLYGLLQLFTVLSIPVLVTYNGERGSWKGMKWLFYIYYPANLIVVGILRLMLYGDVPLLF